MMSKVMSPYYVQVESLRSKQDYRVDHVVGNPAIVRKETLRLIPAKRNAEQGGSQRKRYRENGVRVVTHGRLVH